MTISQEQKSAKVADDQARTLARAWLDRTRKIKHNVKVDVTSSAPAAGTNAPAHASMQSVKQVGNGYNIYIHTVCTCMSERYIIERTTRHLVLILVPAYDVRR